MILILLIILVVVFLLVWKHRRAPATAPQRLPPTREIELFGCGNVGECGYWCPEPIIHDDGSIELNNKVCCCAYQHKKIPRGSPCPFVEEHPELVRDFII